MTDFIIEGVRTDVLTVGDLRMMLDKVPDDTVVWGFNQTDGTFTTATAATHDKRVHGFNIWTDTP